MATANHFSTALLPVIGLLTVTATIGCSTLQDQPGMPSSADATAALVTDPTVVVQLCRDKAEPEYLRAPLKKSMLVQDALKGSGAIHRFRRMDITLVRTSPSGEKLRLPVEFSPSTRRVVDENNYAMHGGDLLEVTEDTSTSLDRMIQSALQPLRPVMRGYRD